MPSIEVREKDLQEYNTNLVRANKEYATKLDQYVNGVILPMASDFTDITTPEDKILTDAFRRCLLEATEFAYSMWRLQANFRNITITHQIANGGPSCLTGPPLDEYFCMAPSVAALQGIQEEVVQAVAEGVSLQFADWQYNVTVPNLLWYPTFLRVHGPIAPPTPNVPMPLIHCKSDKLSCITNYYEMQSAIEQHLTSRHKELDQYDNFILGLCLKICLFFLGAMVTTRASNVIGTGPTAWIPPTSYTPPVPGPVTRGWIITTGAHFVT